MGKVPSEKAAEAARQSSSYLRHGTVRSVVKFDPLSFQIFLKWLLKRRTYTWNSTGAKFIPENKTK